MQATMKKEKKYYPPAVVPPLDIGDRVMMRHGGQFSYGTVIDTLAGDGRLETRHLVRVDDGTTKWARSYHLAFHPTPEQIARVSEQVRRSWTDPSLRKGLGLPSNKCGLALGDWSDGDWSDEFDDQDDQD